MTNPEEEEQKRTLAERIGDVLPDAGVVADVGAAAVDVLTSVVDVGAVVVEAIAAVASAISDS